MHDLMTGMFWGGVVMALPPVLLGVGMFVFAMKQRSRGERHASRTQPVANRHGHYLSWRLQACSSSAALHESRSALMSGPERM